MKSKSIVLLLLGATLFVTSCKKTEEIATEESATSTTEAPVITTTPAATPATPAGEAPKLNPPHGEPFHRCDIAVGAPLDGPSNPNAEANMNTGASTGEPKSFFKSVQSTNPTPAPTQPSPTATATTPQATQPAATPNTPKPALNPAHGQPHHRCDIAVGAPLT